MKISFDLDQTLIPANKDEFEVEAQQWWHRLLGLEPLRLGNVQLFRELVSQGHQVGVYTTSYRSMIKIRLQFWLYGLRPSFIINKKRIEKY